MPLLHVLSALLLSLLIAGCGVGFGAGDRAGTADLLVSRDFGSNVMLDQSLEDLAESDTVLRVLDRNTDIETAYGGGFVESINGLSSGVRDGKPHDWLYFINGIEADRGSAEISIGDGDQIWWDYRNWSVTTSVPAVVGQFPAPFADRHGDPSGQAQVVCIPGADEACELAEDRLEAAGAELTEGGAASGQVKQVVVGIWGNMSQEPIGKRVAAGPQRSGVYIRAAPGAPHLQALDENGDVARLLGPGTGVVAATKIGGFDSVWLVTGTDRLGVERAARALNTSDLKYRFAALIESDEVQSLPIR